MLHINDIYDEEGELEDYPDPCSEYLRVLNPNSSLNDATYCYVSKGYLEDCVDDPEDSQWAIGWWKYVDGVDYSVLINGKDDNYKIKNEVLITNGQGFMGNFSIGHTVDLVSNGEVPLAVTKIQTECNSAPLIINYLPVDICLSDLSIADIFTEDGELDDYPDPCSEYIRDLDPNSSLTKHTYCYISAGYLEDCVDEPEESQWAIGWWEYVDGIDYSVLINANDDQGLKLKTAVSIPSGHGFMGNFSIGHSLDILFPGATTVPSKQ